jgi:hypothetical protein
MLVKNDQPSFRPFINRRMLHSVFPERDELSGHIWSYSICPAGIVPPRPDDLFQKFEVPAELLAVHSIFRRKGWYFLRPRELNNPVVRFACQPNHIDRTEFLFEDLLRPGLQVPPDLRPQCYHFPKAPAELFSPCYTVAQKLSEVERIMHVPVDFEMQFLGTLRLAIEHAIEQGVWLFWDKT